jgi:hypothetical protein
MMNTWVLSALWVGLALIATLIAIWFRMSTALSEIVVGTVAQLIIGAAFAHGGRLGNICRDAGTRIQHNRIRKSDSGSMFVNDLGTVIALGLICSPLRTLSCDGSTLSEIGRIIE